MLIAIKNLYKDSAFYVAVFITITIAFLSLFNVNKLTPDVNLSHIDKYEHFTAYFVLTLSWLFVFQKSVKLINYRFGLVTLVFLYGILMEVLQQILTDYRQADLFDVFANTSGIIIAILFFEKIVHKKFKDFLGAK